METATLEFEKRKWEYMEKNMYCILKIAEVIEHLPYYYVELVYERAIEKYGKELDYNDIRKVKNCLVKDKMIADLINEIGKEHKK
jgi:hypothetical protein